MNIAKPAVFLDRDGVISKEEGYILTSKDLHIFSYSKESISRLHREGFLVFVVTNQSAVARGLLELSELINMNNKLVSEIGVDNVYYCPHYPVKDYKGGISSLLIECDCRKPNTGMIKKACDDYDIDLKRSWLVGDRWSDMEMGKNVGLHSILIASGITAEREIPEKMYITKVKSLVEATNFILLNKYSSFHTINYSES